MKNWKFIGVLMLSVMLMASGCEKGGNVSPDDSTAAPAVTAADGSAPLETEPIVTRADGGVIDSDEVDDVVVKETEPVVTTQAAPEETKEQIVEILEDGESDVDNGSPEEMAEIIEAAVSEDKNSDVDAPDISGEWEDAENALKSVSIEKVEGNVYKATVIIAAKKGTGALWELVLRYVDGKYVYSNGKKYTYTNKDGSLNSTEVYSDGTGSLTLEEGHLTWKDDKEDQGKDLVFVKQ